MTQTQALRRERRRYEQERRERRLHALQTALYVLLIVAAFGLFVAVGGDDVEELQRHDEWMQQLKEDGAWVMW